MAHTSYDTCWYPVPYTTYPTHSESLNGKQMSTKLGGGKDLRDPHRPWD